MFRQEYEVLEKGLGTKGEALAAEALWAARRILKNPHTARGGPWSKPTLSAEMLDEVQEVAPLRSWLSLEAVAAVTPGHIPFLSSHD